MIDRKDDGFSVVEVIIAMFLLAVLALAVLPLMIGATRVSVTNKDLVAATTFANSELARIRADFTSDLAVPTRCGDLRARSVSVAAPHLDPSGTGMAASIAIGACPAASQDYPASIPVTVTVRSSAGTILTELPTLILVVDP